MLTIHSHHQVLNDRSVKRHLGLGRGQCTCSVKAQAVDGLGSEARWSRSQRLNPAAAVQKPPWPTQGWLPAAALKGCFTSKHQI